MTQLADDGHVGLSLEPVTHVLRLLPAPADGPNPPYVASGLLMRMSDRVAKIVGLTGKVSIRHQRLIARTLLEAGFELLYVERIDGRTVPLAERITYGDWAGYWRLDLRVAVRRNRTRNGRPAGAARPA